jgi:hypothetical protein
VKGIALTIFNYCKALYLVCRGKDAYAKHMVNAAKRGDGPYVKTLLSFARIGDSFVSNALNNAVIFGHLEVVKIIIQDIRVNRIFLSYKLDREGHKTLVDNAINYQHNELVRFILNALDNYPVINSQLDYVRFASIFFDLLDKYITQGNLKGVETLVECYGERSVKDFLPGNARKLIKYAVNHGNHELLRFIKKNFTTPSSRWRFTNLVQESINRENLEEVKTYTECCGERSDNDTLYKFESRDYIFFDSAVTGRTLFESRDYIFLDSAVTGRTLIVEYLLKHVQFALNDYNLSLRGAASNGHFEVMRLIRPKSDQKGIDKALEYESLSSSHESMELLPFSSKEGRLTALMNGVRLNKKNGFKFSVSINPKKVAPLMPMPIPDYILRATIKLNRCRTNGQILEFIDAELKLRTDSIRQIALKQCSRHLAFRRVVAMKLADSEKIKPGVCNQRTVKRFFQLIEQRIFYGHQDFFIAKNLTCARP